MDCEKHPLKYNGYTSEKFKEEFKMWSSQYIKDFFQELHREYKDQSSGDKKRGREQLASNLENLATSLYLTTKFIETKKGTTPLRIPKDLAKGFGNTNYFYQEQIFREIKKELPRVFETAIKAMNKVCKSCEKHMKPYEVK